MNAHTIPELRYAMSREAIIGHDTAWKVSRFGVAQYLGDEGFLGVVGGIAGRRAVLRFLGLGEVLQDNAGIHAEVNRDQRQHDGAQPDFSAAPQGDAAAAPVFDILAFA